MHPSPPFRTNRLFSPRALDRLVSERPNGPPSARGRRTVEELRTLWDRSGPGNENATGRASVTSFVHAMLGALGHTVGTNDVDADGVGRESTDEPWLLDPDYDGGDPDEAAVAVVQVEPWDRPLDVGTDEFCPPPSYTLHARLQAAPVRWGLVTNGRRWRLYHESTSHRLDEFYEVDLGGVSEAADHDGFAELYALVGRPAFRSDPAEPHLLGRLHAATRANAAADRDALAENVRDAITTLANALATASTAHPDEESAADSASPAHVGRSVGRPSLDHLEAASTTLVFRTLAALFAESRGRLTFDGLGDGGRSSAVDGLRELARNRHDSREPAARFECGTRLAARVKGSRWQTLLGALDSLSEDVYHARRRRPGDGRSTPSPGPLFRSGTGASSPPAERLLRESTVADEVVTRLLELLTQYRDDDGNRRDVEYRHLNPSILGDLYEGLLGFELTAATTDTADTADTDDIGEPGPTSDSAAEISLRPNADERKATGSFYTPRRVVEHVVDETLEPLLDDGRDGATPTDNVDAGHGDGEAGRSRNEARRERLRSLDVVDPAVGTGHFLLAVIDALALELVAAGEGRASESATAGDPTAVEVARATVARNCIYGVDRDPMAVDLARAICWIRASPSDPAPETLFDHLAVGDALRGVDDPSTLLDRGADRERVVRETGGEPGPSSWRSIPDDRLRALANVRTAVQTGLAVPEDGIERLETGLRNDETWDAVTDEPWFETAQERATTEQYFHWPLAFPSVFGGDDSAGDRPYESAGDPIGFDAAIANPPWVATAGRDGISAAIDTDRRPALESTYETATGQFDLYAIFVERAVRLTGGGRVGVVVPDSILARESNEPIRSYLLSNCPPAHVVRLGRAFEDVEAGVAAVICGGSPDAVECADATRHAGGALATSDADSIDPAKLPTASIPLSVFESAAAHRFLIHLDEATRAVLDRVERARTLGSFATISRGEEMSKRADALTDGSQNARRPILPGAAVRRYGIDEAEVRYVNPADLQKDERTYRAPKLCFRQTGEALVGTYDPEGLATIKSVYSIHVDGGAPGVGDEPWEPSATLKHVLGVLSSPLLAWYHHYKHAAYRSVFPQINQSTFAAFPVAIPDGPDDRLVSLVEERLATTEERADLDPDPGRFLDADVDGRPLGELPDCRPAENVGGTRLVDTTEEWPGLRIGAVDASVVDEVVDVAATVRYKPGDDRADTDRWGFVETDPIPALTVDGVTEERAALIEAVVSTAAGHGDGGVRPQATKTISPLDRLLAATIPPLTAVRDDLRAYRRERERARELDERIDRLDGRIAERVFDLYGVPARERALVSREFG